MPQESEAFIFLTIKDVAQFKKALSSFRPTTALDTYNNLGSICRQKAIRRTDWARVELIQTQIAFSRAGLDKLGEEGSTEDSFFDKGSMRDAKEELGDQLEWDPIFDKGGIHAVIIVAASRECWQQS